MAKTRTTLPEDLRKWFGKGKEGGVGGGGWDRYNTKGERIGKCGGAEDRGGEGEGKPKCLSKQKADQLRAKGGKQAIANAVKRKKEADPVTDRKGTGNAPRPVSNRIDEANEPTNPGLWSRAKAEAKKRFDVYPCVPLDSLAITKSGPTSHEDLEIGDKILTYNMQKNVLEWKPVIHKHYYENAPLVEIGKPTGFSLRCTPNHKWVIKSHDGCKLVETKDINTHMRILMCAILPDESSLKLESWSKKDSWIDHIFSMNQHEREIFLASSIVYDGWDKGPSSKYNTRHTFGFSQKNSDHLWASMLSAFLNGYYVTYTQRDNVTGGIHSATYIRNKHTHSTQNLYKRDAGVDSVWCPTTENETWVMIQNGLITITGNSAYANGWAAKWYKARGGGWRSKKSEETNTPSDREWGTSSLVHIYQQDTPGEQEQLDIPLRSVNERIVKVDGKWRLVSTTTGKNLGTYDTRAGAEKRERQVQYFKHQEEMTLPSFSEYLREFGDRPFTWKITADTSEYMTARFDPPMLPGEEPFHYEVFLVATKYPERKVRPGIPTLPPLPIEWEFGFALVRPSNTKYDRTSAELRDGKYYYDTLVGDTKMSLAVMSTIGAVFAQMLRMRRPVRVFFSAKGESRVRLYRRLAGRIASAVPGYSAKEEKPGYWAVTPTRG